MGLCHCLLPLTQYKVQVSNHILKYALLLCCVLSESFVLSLHQEPFPSLPMHIAKGQIEIFVSPDGYAISSYFLLEHMTFLLWVLEQEVIQYLQERFTSADYESEYTGLSWFITDFWCPGFKNSPAFSSSIAVYFIYSILMLYGFPYLLNSLVLFVCTNIRTFITRVWLDFHSFPIMQISMATKRGWTR